MAFVVQEEDGVLDVTLRELRRSPLLGVLWSLAALVGVVTALLGYTAWPVGAFCLVALLLAPLAFAPVREGLRLSGGQLSHCVIIYGRTCKNRRVPVDSRTFYVPEPARFLSGQPSTPVLRLSDSKWAVGGGYFTLEEAEELAARLNAYLRRPA
ncbi:MAG: hypothetical protein LLG08_06395 [Actinomycetia bacterium]|nr:hypothetical protein [Actinomycetes bacterium]